MYMQKAERLKQNANMCMGDLIPKNNFFNRDI